MKGRNEYEWEKVSHILFIIYIYIYLYIQTDSNLSTSVIQYKYSLVSLMLRSRVHLMQIEFELRVKEAYHSKVKSHVGKPADERCQVASSVLEVIMYGRLLFYTRTLTELQVAVHYNLSLLSTYC